MLSVVLKEATKEEHQQLEKKVVSRLKRISSEEHYADILHSFYRYFSALEQKIAPLIPEAIVPDYPIRRKTSLLEQDLIYYITQQPGNRITTPEITNWLQAIGALYVMEGSTLGGSIIKKLLHDKHNINKGTSFFEGYGDQTLEMWRNFTNAINKHITDPSDQLSVINAAKETFQKFSMIIDE